MTTVPLPLLQRVAAEKRAIVLPLALALVANILAYAFVVYPLGVKSAGAADRAATLTRGAATKIATSPRTSLLIESPPPSQNPPMTSYAGYPNPVKITRT